MTWRTIFGRLPVAVATLAVALVAAVPLAAAAAVPADQPAMGVVQGPYGLCLDVAGAGTADGTARRQAGASPEQIAGRLNAIL